MDQRQSFNVTADFFSGFTAAFIKLVFLLVIVYLLMMLFNFLRDKFINKETDTRKEEIHNLLIILNKIFYVSGFGFIIANIIQSIFNHATQGNGNAMMNFKGEWDYLTFGIILIFVGISFKHANKAISSSKTQA